MSNQKALARKSTSTNTETQENQFEGRGFAVQKKSDVQNQKSDLNTQLKQAKTFGHSISKLAGQESSSASPQTSGLSIQAKLSIGEPGDKYEQEADRVASEVVQRINAPSLTEESIQREGIDEETDGVAGTGATPLQWLNEKSAMSYLWDGIVEGMDLSSAADKLLENFNARTDFRYEGGTMGIFKGQGDCGTLADEFCQILIYGFGFSGITTGNYNGQMLVERSRIIDSAGKMGNVDYGQAWIFKEHHWVKVGGQDYDVLFGQKGLKDYTPGKKDNENMNMFVFGDKKYVALGDVDDPTRKYKKVTGKLRNLL